ncbi:MAG: putative quinol monooxygenase [Planctomycetota bacterium]
MVIHVVARAVARPEARGALQAALLAVVDPTRREPGCRRYEVCQSVDDLDEFVVIEEWRSQDDIDAHMRSTHVQTLLATVADLVAAPPEIRGYRTVT